MPGGSEVSVFHHVDGHRGSLIIVSDMPFPVVHLQGIPALTQVHLEV
jgi:hypothetical protein